MAENRDNQQRLVALNLPVLDSSAPTPVTSDDVKTVTLKVDPSLKVSLAKNQVSDCSAQRLSKDKSAWTPCLDKVELAVRSEPRAKDFGVTIDASPTVPFGFIVGIIHRLHRAEVSKVGMLPRVAEGGE